MAIKITDNFQVNIKNPIDNRFVVGSQSIPGGPGSIYPTPFYAYRDDISSNIGFVYPGLRIWDFNDNLPYVWTGTTWSNENLTGASVLDSGTPGFTTGGGYQNYITKFYDTSTVLTKSLLFDNNVHVSLDVSPVNPNNSGGPGIGNQPLLDSSTSVPKGLHVKGRIRTNTGFVGSGRYIHQINAGNIDGGLNNGGRLQLQYISTSGTLPTTNPTTMYVLTNNNGGLTSWQNILNVAPFWKPRFLGLGNTTANGSAAVSLYSGENPSGNFYEFFSLISSGLQIDAGSVFGSSVRIESKAASNVGGGSASIYKGLDSNRIHEFKTINSNFMSITQTSDVINLNSNITSSSLQVNPNGPHGITIEIPATFEGTDYYVNNGYGGVEELGTRSKPFRTLKACINKILNRTSNSGPSSFVGGFINGDFNQGPQYGGQINVTPDTFNPLINNGQAYKKWEIRTGPNEPKPTYLNNYQSSLPGGGAVRVIIQSYSEIDENLAINGVTYLLEKQGVSMIQVLADYYNDPGMPENGQPFRYLFDMTPLAGTADSNLAGTELTGVPKGNPVIWTGTQLISVSKPFQMNYGLSCRLEGNGTVVFSGNHIKRRGFFRSKGINSYDFSLAAKIINPSVQVVNDPSNRVDEFDCTLHIGSEAGYIYCYMYQIPDSANLAVETPHITRTGYLYDAENNQITREGVTMSGYLTNAVPDYGSVQVEGRNMMFGESLFLAGTIQIGCFEQHMVYAKDYGTIYSESGRIYMRRNYQQVLYSRVEFMPIDREQNLVDRIFGGSYYKITSVNSSGTGATNWKKADYFDQNSWKDQNGNPILASTLPASLTSPAWIGLSVKLLNSPVGPIGTNGRATRALKLYRPCNHVYDIYLKNGAMWNHGGDFYTQQNTGANQGGPCAFLGIENNIPRTGDATHPIDPNVQQNTTSCSFRATGGGFVTNLFYNYHIKYILDSSYLANRYDYKHNITFKSLKIDSNIFNSVIGVFWTSGANAANNYLTNPSTLLGSSSVNWTTQFIFIGSFTNCYLYDVAPGSSLRTPFSNVTINNGIGKASTGPGLLPDGFPVQYYGVMSISGTSIELSSGSINTSIPLYTGNADALAYGYPVGGIYLDYNETEPILKVVKNP